LAAEKSALRETALARRARCNPALGEKLAEHVLRDCPPPKGAIVAGFWPLEGEINIYPLLEALAAKGLQLCLPVTPKKGAPLTFHAWSPGEPLSPGRFGTMQPAPSGAMTPDFILTPLLAFDRFGNRLGYGGGYYDRTFAAYPSAFRLGCAFAAQACAHIPTDQHDVKLHAVATERSVVSFQSSVLRTSDN
jgi:5-formyltetrahydrofolate cyclo-ligase